MLEGGVLGMGEMGGGGVWRIWLFERLEMGGSFLVGDGMGWDGEVRGVMWIWEVGGSGVRDGMGWGEGWFMYGALCVCRQRGLLVCED